MINRILSLSIRTHLIVLVCLLIFPSIILVIYSGLLEREQAINDAQDSCMRFVNILASRQQSMVVGAEQLTMALSMLPAVQSKNADAVNAILSALPRKNIQYSIITVADRTGLIWASSIPSKGKAFLTDRKYFQDVLRTGMFTSGGYVIGRITKKPILVFGSPVRNSKNVLSGVMSIGLVLDYAQDEFEKAKLPAGTFFSMLDHNGVIIYTNSQNSTQKMLQGSRDIKEEAFTAMSRGTDEGTFNATGNDGNVRLFAYKKLRLSHEQDQYLYIRASMTHAAVTAAATDKMQKYLSILVLIFIFGLSVSWLIGKRAIIDRIKILESAAKKLSEGTAYATVSNLVQGAELGKLATTFDNMVVVLSEREKALQASEHSYQRITENMNCIVTEVDTEGIITYISPSDKKILGDRALILGSSAFNKIHPEDRDRVTSHYMEAIRARKSSEVEYRVQHADGHYIWVHSSGHSLFNDAGEYAGMIITTSDVNQRKQADLRLKEAEEKFRTIADFTYDWENWINIDGKPIWISPSIERISGYSVSECMAMPDYPLPIIYPDDRDMIVIEMRNANERPLEDIEFRMIKKDGTMRWGTVSTNPVFTEEGHNLGHRSSIRDVTERKQAESHREAALAERKQMESQLFQSQKMEAIGTLAGGIAHDFNNILSVIIGYTELARDRNQQKDKEQYLQKILKGAERAKNLVKQILTFSRQDDHEKKPLDIKVLLKEAIKFLRSSIPTTIEIDQYITEDDCTVMADPTQMHQIIMNLCSNASHAMKETGGTLKIELTNIELTKGDLPENPELQSGHYVKLTVSDTGYGIDPALIQRIFDPFFTTKSVDEGTGLGLSVVYGIVKSHGGVINVYSKRGKGAAFHIYLPGIIQKETMLMDLDKPVIGGTERILFVDDEQLLVDIGIRMLISLGYDVTGVMSSVDALNMVNSEPHFFDLVITDMTLPKMTGIDLSRKLLQIRPDIPIILCSGIKEPKTEAQAKSMGIKAYLAKPLTKRELSKAMREVLDGGE